MKEKEKLKEAYYQGKLTAEELKRLLGELKEKTKLPFKKRSKNNCIWDKVKKELG